MRKILVALLLVPVAALAQGAPKDWPGPEGRGPDPARLEKRMRLARTLGLAVALDLDPAQALKLGDAMAKFDDRRQAARKQAADAREVLRKAAQDDKAAAVDVDGAIGKLLDSRAQLLATDKEMLAAVTMDLTPEQKARAALFLGRFRERIERRVMSFGPAGVGHGMQGMRGSGMHGTGMMGPGTQECPMPPGAKPSPTGVRTPKGGDQLSARSGKALDDAEFDPPPFADEEED